ncbi:MAG: DUF3501 family protein, partial [Myxococcota bacterium]|nr:DUF3501 family protein [Myxococcota bacterium]
IAETRSPATGEERKMGKVSRDEIVDYQTYNDGRPESRARVMKTKAMRRVHVGPHLTFLFENADTVRYQVQEMMRVERIVREADIQHELDTYNELLGGPGEVGATLLIEIDDPAQRDELLGQWLEMPKHLYVAVEDGDRVRASFDPRQVGDDRLSSVQYLKFDTAGRTPVAVGCDLPSHTHEATLSDEQRTALLEDLHA